MNKTYRPDGLWSLDTDQDHIIHRIGSDDYPELRHTTVKDPSRYEEIAMSDIPPYTEAQYKAKVSELIHRRYSLDDEIALRANIEDAPTDKRTSEYAEYLAYRKQCKAEAKEILAAMADSKAEPEDVGETE